MCFDSCFWHPPPPPAEAQRQMRRFASDNRRGSHIKKKLKNTLGKVCMWWGNCSFFFFLSFFQLAGRSSSRGGGQAARQAGGVLAGAGSSWRREGNCDYSQPASQRYQHYPATATYFESPRIRFRGLTRSPPTPSANGYAADVTLFAFGYDAMPRCQDVPPWGGL